ncbi:MAG: hypothetical protein NTW86_14185 [Candidatus Sumerlaeota bacterium]|nr:hypothetical protein [Candidatus Sumerlaeota bacterium]
MKRLLMIAYDFPPLLPGVRRVVAFARYLPEFGWRADVLTVKPVRSWAYDAQPLEDLEKRGVRIFRCGSWDPHRFAYLASRLRSKTRNTASMESRLQAERLTGVSTPIPRIPPEGGTPYSPFGKRALDWLRRHWFCPDDRVGWVGPASRMAVHLVQREKPDAVWTTSFPHSAHLVGLRVKERFPRLSWIADFRDGWTQNADFFAPLSLRLRVKSMVLERQVAAWADAIVGISDALTAHFRDLAGERGDARQRLETIPNGFDPADLEAARPREWPGFTLAYAGTLHGSRSAEPLFAAAAEAAKLDEAMGRDLRLLFVGAFGKDLWDCAERFGLRERVIAVGPLPYRETLGALKGAGALAVLVAREPNAAIMMTQKVFECLALGPPVLALAPPSACRTLVERVGGAVAVDPDDPTAAARALCEIRRRAQSGQWRRAAPEALAPYNRRHLTRDLARLLDEMCGV